MSRLYKLCTSNVFGYQDFFSDCVATEEVAPLASKMAGARCTLKSALQTSFQICAVLFDKPRDAFTGTLDRLGEGVVCSLR